MADRGEDGEDGGESGTEQHFEISFFGPTAEFPLKVRGRINREREEEGGSGRGDK